MKIISLLVLTLFIGIGKGCENEKKQAIDTAVVEYTANTRGFYQKITVKQQTVSVSNDRDGNDKPAVEKISDADWKELIEAFQTVDLEKLPNLKAPTDKRSYDGAAIGNLKVIFKDKTYETSGFDNGYPPQEIEKLVNKVVSLVKKE